MTSGLLYDWQKTHAVYLFEEDIPKWLMDLGWSWEDELTTTKLLGIHIADEIVPGLMQE